jgi:hypothetical protein
MTRITNRPASEFSIHLRNEVQAVDGHMKHSEFRIGLEFWCGGTRWRCSDVGTRVVTAVSLEPHAVVKITSQGGTPKSSQTRRYITGDPDWLLGPPYKIAETVFDEYDIEACSLNRGAADR